MRQKIIGLLIIVLITGCEKIGEYYLGMNMQPDLPREDFKPGLNVYGVLKTGESLDSLNHYFEVQQLVFVKDAYDSSYVERADISLTREPVSGTVMDYHLNYFRDGIYLNENIETAPGDRWLYKCSYDTFEVTAECVIPNLPLLKVPAIIATDHSIQFTVVSDTTACMYDVYLLNGDNFFFEKRIPLKGIDSQFNLKPEWDTSVGTNGLFIFASDKNLEKYYTTSNTFFKPNAFRPSFSTVDGGCGTFGGISSTMVVIN
jgi:hypothetical protein